MSNYLSPIKLQDLAQDIHEWNVKQGFWDNKSDSNEEKAMKIALMHSELSEALEAVRKNLQDDHLPEFRGEIVEMADVIIRVLDYCYAYGFDIDEVVEAKLKYNFTRPYKHGKAF